MINNADFTKRLQKVIDYYGESASSFAEKIGVQRSSISHILSGRNKPSLDFVLKVLSSFPEVELYWLMNGKGVFPKDEKPTQITTPQKPTPVKIEKETKTEVQNIPQTKPQTESEILKSIAPNNKTIDKIVIFYTDGTFKDFKKE